MAPPYQAVVIGASAGGLKVLLSLLPQLPADYPLPIMIVIHIPPDRPSLIPSLFAERAAMRVVEAEDKSDIDPGTVYFAPPDYHLLVERELCLSLSSDAPVLFSRPSIDVLFETAAEAYGPSLLGVVLSGASQDGAAGLRAVIDEGGRGLIQLPATAEASFMPEAAALSCPEASLLTPEDIVTELKKAGGLPCLND